MSIEEVKKEIYYYTGKKNVSDQEAKEILWYVNNGKDLGEVIQAYYNY